MFIIDFLRNRALKKHGSQISTNITPLKDIHTAVSFIDVEDTSFDACKNDIMAFYRENGIKGEIFYFDFRKISDSERLITSITNTVLKKDLNFYGKPSKDKLDLMLAAKPDLFISLINKDDYPIRYMATCCEAKFKIGRKQIPGDIFDLVIKEQDGQGVAPLPEEEIFKSIKAFLAKVK
ncbi:MAG: hypothetical protein IKQ64_01740 [Bacteroidales bacterium]|nr:hypothetical protein [Bacteroidales bacterium]